MNQYHKINSIFKRDEKGKFLIGEYSDPEVEYLKDNLWFFTEKVDGINIRIKWYDPDGEHRFGPNHLKFGGKTHNAQIPANLVNRLNELFPDPQKFQDKFGDDDVCLYGEGYGAGIQKGGGDYFPSGLDVGFILFDVKIGDWWLKRTDVIDIANHFNIRVVPQIGIYTIPDAIDIVSKGFDSFIPGASKQAEGVIGTPLVPLRTRRGDRIITKIKTVDFTKLS